MSKSKSDSPSNERSRSIEQNPTYLKNLESKMYDPRHTSGTMDQKLNNFDMIPSHQSHDRRRMQRTSNETRKNHPSNGVEELNQSHPVRNK